MQQNTILRTTYELGKQDMILNETSMKASCGVPFVGTFVT